MGKVVLITGASSGIGKVTAIKLKKAGFKVYACARRVDALETLKNYDINTFYMDISVDDSIVSGVNHVIQKEGKIDILINNAGFALYGALEDIPLNEARYQFEVNLFGLARLTQLVLPHMRKNKGGKILNISSIGGKIATPLGSWYHSTKFALEGLSDCLRLELKQFNIDVILIQPGATKTSLGNIAKEKAVQRSGSGEYKDMALKIERILSEVEKSRLCANADTVAKEILKAILSKKPKTRYTPTFSAKSTLLLRKILTDKHFDKAILTLFNKI
jgi:short-subunit dehydrogenase